MTDLLAQTSAAVYIIPGIGFVAIIGVYAWVSRHMANTKIHPEKKDIVYGDVCDTRHELENKRADERHEELKEGLAEIKRMIRSNGK